MSVVAPTIQKNVHPNMHTILVTWVLANGDTGAPVSFTHHGERSWQVTGTLGAGGTMAYQGSNDGTNYVTLKDKQGNAASVTALGLTTTADKPLYIRPNCTAGDGTTALTVVVALSKS